MGSAKHVIDPTTGKIDDKKEITDDIEFILSDIGGSYGKFQLWNVTLFSIPIFINGLIVVAFVFTTLSVDYRCYIPECDDIEYSQYDTEWLKNAVPFMQSKPSKCYRYESTTNTEIIPSHITNSDRQTNIVNQFCAKEESFNKSHIVRCNQDGLIFRTDEISIANEFDITCEENEWRLASVGAYNNIVRLIVLPLFGVISDKYGRRTVLIWSLITSAFAGMIQSYSVNFTMFLICEIICATTACPIFTCALVLGLEWAGSRERVIVNAIINFPLHLGFAVLGMTASIVRDFRPLLRYVYGPGLLVGCLMFFGPESFRWLIANGKRKQIERILKSAAKINNRELSSRTWDVLDRKCNEAAAESNANMGNSEAKAIEAHAYRSVFTSWIFIMRICINSLCWITGNFVGQGIAIMGVSLQGDKYLNFIILSLGAIPSALMSIFVQKFVGRRTGITLCFLLSAVTVICGRILPVEYSKLALMLFLIARCFAMAAFLIVYVHSSEMWPTSVRHTMVGISSTIGRIGAVLAPLNPLLSTYAEILPFLSFGAMSLVTGLLVLLLPETKNAKMPETFEDAKFLGKKQPNPGHS